MRNSLTLLFAVLISFASFGNGPGKAAEAAIEGKVIDISNAEALTGATIFIRELNLTAYASFDGSFSFDAVPAGSYTVEVSYISYDKVVVENLEVKAGKTFKKFTLSTI